MALISDALRQAFMPKHEYESLREEDRAWVKLQRPLWISTVGTICLVIFVSTTVSLKIVFPGDNGKRPFCNGIRLQPLPMKNGGDSDLFPGAFYLTDQETVDYYWMVVFVPSMIVFLASLAYLVAGKDFLFEGFSRFCFHFWVMEVLLIVCFNGTWLFMRIGFHLWNKMQLFFNC